MASEKLKELLNKAVAREIHARAILEENREDEEEHHDVYTTSGEADSSGLVEA